MLTEFQAGMERRAIDWKASARHASLLAREFHTERDNMIVFAVDAGRAMTDPVGASGGVVSGAITLAGSETLPAASACIACRISPLVCGVVSVAL